MLAHGFFPVSFGCVFVLIFKQAIARWVEAVVLVFQTGLAGGDESSCFVVAVFVWTLGGVDACELAYWVVVVHAAHRLVFADEWAVGAQVLEA